MRRPLLTLRQALLAVVFGVLLSTAWVSIAAADAVYHSQHIDLMPVGGAALRSGFVENIHANGPQVYANERYVLNGAAPRTSYQVTLILYPFDTSCSTAAVALPTATVQTNVSGNGVGHARFTPAAVPEALRGATHGIRWELSSGGSVAYATACSAVTLD
jgi:hypothetical protein